MIYPYEIIAALLRILDRVKPLAVLLAAWAIVAVLAALGR